VLQRLPIERVTVTTPDTDVTPYDKSTSSSRTTFHMGRAAQIAAGQIRDQLLHAGAKSLEARVEDLESGTSGRAGGLICEPLKAVWPATPACLLLEHL
jgi:CO/xanthine dehydrogenase Mo-binding subunit